MARITDEIRTTCKECGRVVPEVVRRREINVQLNGPGGQFPNQTLGAGDVIEGAFRKNGGGWGVIKDDYEILRDAKPGCRLVLYARLVLKEEVV